MELKAALCVHHYFMRMPSITDRAREKLQMEVWEERRSDESRRSVVPVSCTKSEDKRVSSETQTITLASSSGSIFQL